MYFLYVFQGNNKSAQFCFRALKKFYSLLCTALLTDFKAAEDCDHICEEAFIPKISSLVNLSKPVTSKCLHTSGQSLPTNCILRRILQVQQFDLMGCEHYSSYINDCDLSNWNYVDMLLQEVHKDKNGCAKCVIVREIKKDLQDTRPRSSLSFVPYLIAAVARDCSMMLTFRKIEGGNTW